MAFLHLFAGICMFASLKKLWLVLVSVVFVSVTNAQIYQFHGPNRDGKFPESNLLKEWPEGGPELLLEFEGIGEGWDQSFPNTRSTPTIEGDRIYIISGIGELVCLNAETGNLNWKINVDEEYQAEWHVWDVAESPLIVDEKVICSPAGTLTTFVAFDKMTGKEIWKTPGTDGQRSYVSPILSTFNSKEYILGASASDLFIVDPENGESQ